VRWLVPIALFIMIWSLIDGPAMLSLLQQANGAWLLTGVLLVQVQIIVSAIRWQLTAKRLGQSLGLVHVVQEYSLATLLNQVLPGGVTGDVARVARNRGSTGAARVAQGVVIERLAGQVTLFAITLLGIVAWPWLLGASAPPIGARVLTGLGAVAIGVAIVCALLWVVGPPRLRGYIASFKPAVHQAWIADGVWMAQALLSLVIVASYIGLFALCAYAVDEPLPVVGLITIVPLTLMAMLLPVSVGGWGVREATAAGLWPLLGLLSEAGIATSILYGLVSLLGSVPGLFFVMRRQSGYRT